MDWKHAAGSAGFVLAGLAAFALLAGCIWLWWKQDDFDAKCATICGGDRYVYESVQGIGVPGHCTCWLGHDHLLKYNEVGPSVDLFGECAR